MYELFYKKNCIVTLELAKEIVALRLRVQNGVSCPGIAYVDESVIMTTAARKYLANEGYEGVSRAALISTSKMKGIMINVFLW
ncbi:MAG: hypothetical protein H7259_01855 [Cytophagales bacterium]|nr:hypothetical protein [Cytophaga sp.]